MLQLHYSYMDRDWFLCFHMYRQPSVEPWHVGFFISLITARIARKML